MADTQTLQSLEHELLVLLRRIRRLVVERARTVHPDLSPVGYSMLLALQDTGPQRASDLVGLFAIDKGAVSRQVGALLDLGLIERSPDPQDRRAAILALTDEGSRRIAAVAAERLREIGERLAEWEPGELETLVSLMSRYNAALE